MYNKVQLLISLKNVIKFGEIVLINFYVVLATKFLLHHLVFTKKELNLTIYLFKT